jgi:16S rRNA (guanine966-N2)-methyltransferase
VAELRIVAGEWRGRRIKVPGRGVRPTADRVREAWMSIVLPALDGARVVDLFAGTGALGLEALSRGAAHCDFVEKDPEVRRVLVENIKTLGAGERATVHAMSAVKALETLVDPDGKEAGRRWEVAFADPPYNMGNAIELAQRWLREPFATIFAVEHEASVTLPTYPGNPGGTAPDRRAYGITALTFYHLRDLPEEQP